jgi:hypothetical protein
MPNIAEIRGISLIFLGDFNPKIFQPSWFASERLITVKEAEDATVSIIHPDVASFNIEWFQLTVERERCQFVCNAQPYFERLVGLASKTFELLRHTPITMMGINNTAHFRANTIEKWHEFGHRLAPKDFWKDLFREPGLQTLTIRQIPRTDDEKGFVQVTVEPSAQIRPGVFAFVNDHYETKTPENVGAVKAVEILTAKWSNSVTFAETVFSKIAEHVI